MDKRRAISRLGPANLIHPGLRPNGSSATALPSLKRISDRRNMAWHPSQIAEGDLSTYLTTNERASVEGPFLWQCSSWDTTSLGAPGGRVMLGQSVRLGERRVGG